MKRSAKAIRANPPTLPISDITIDSRMQSRAEIDQDVVAEYVERMKSGVRFPPVDVFYDGNTTWLVDGFHRYHAAVKRGEDRITAVTHKGDERAAILFSLSANGSHGLRRSNADKHRAVQTILFDVQWSRKADRWIAEKCCVSHTFVGDVRKSLSTADSRSTQEPAETRVGRDRAQPSRFERKTRGRG